VLISLTRLRSSELRVRERARPSRGSMTAGFRYVWARPDLKAMLVILALIGTFGLNFPIFISTMAVRVFNTNAGGYGLLSSLMAVGTVIGALSGARRSMPHFKQLVWASALFGAGCLLAAIAPRYGWFGAALVPIGIAALTLTTTTNSLMQLSTGPAMRGRVLAIRLAVVLGGTPIGAPIVGWVADHWGPRWALVVGAASGIAAAVVAVRAMRREAHLHAGLPSDAPSDAPDRQKQDAP